MTHTRTKGNKTAYMPPNNYIHTLWIILKRNEQSLPQILYLHVDNKDAWILFFLDIQPAVCRQRSNKLKQGYGRPLW